MIGEMFSNNYGDVEGENERADEHTDDYTSPTPEGAFLERDDDFDNHNVGPAPRPPRFGHL